jgi:hypothetical protein
MTPKEKASSLYERYEIILLSLYGGSIHHEIKLCAELAINELILVTEGQGNLYWLNVKRELTKL